MTTSTLKTMSRGSERVYSGGTLQKGDVEDEGGVGCGGRGYTDAAGGRDPTTLSLSITLEVQQAAQDRIIGRVINGRRGFQRMRDVRMEMGCWAGAGLPVRYK